MLLGRQQCLGIVGTLDAAVRAKVLSKVVTKGTKVVGIEGLSASISWVGLEIGLKIRPKELNFLNDSLVVITGLKSLARGLPSWLRRYA
jgi:hypothetical protein